jgi:hypothetical protein
MQNIVALIWQATGERPVLQPSTAISADGIGQVLESVFTARNIKSLSQSLEDGSTHTAIVIPSDTA